MINLKSFKIILIVSKVDEVSVLLRGESRFKKHTKRYSDKEKEELAIKFSFA